GRFGKLREVNTLAGGFALAPWRDALGAIGRVGTEGQRSDTVIAGRDEIVELFEVLGAGRLMHEVPAPCVRRGVADAVEQIETLGRVERLCNGIGIGECERGRIDGHAVTPVKIARSGSGLL